MIIDLPSTTSAAINKSMVDIREKGGTVSLSRVLTLVIVTDESDSEAPIAAANAASFEHPCRVIVIAQGSKRGTARMDAQIRVGGDAGASEVIVLRLFGPMAEHGASVVIPLLLADAPVVAWWPGASPEKPSVDPIGVLAQRRITDAASDRKPRSAILARRGVYAPGDTDLAWTRLTVWRGLLAAALDQPPHDRIVSITVSGASDSASTDLLAAWLSQRLKSPVTRDVSGRAGSGLKSVTLQRRSGEITLARIEGSTATLTMKDQPVRELALPRRTLRDCLSEELRRLDADEVYAEVLTKGLPLKDAAPKKPATRAAASKPAAAKPATAKPAAAKATTDTAPKVTTPKAAASKGTPAKPPSATITAAKATPVRTPRKAAPKKAKS
ncbi:MAG: glucose-6-phosphate dehydrogenase assembly protein OpcA [Nakamurella sp.]